MIHAFIRLRGLLVRLIRERAGTATIEYAFVAPVMVLLLCGAVDFGRAMYDGTSVVSAARAAVEFAVAAPTDTVGIQAAAAQASKLNAATLQVLPSRFCECAGGATINCAAAACADGSAVREFLRVSVTTPFQPILALTQPMLPSELSSAATLRVR